MAKKVNGVDAIVGSVGPLPRKVGLEFLLVGKQQLLMNHWNHRHIAIIPYCIKCKVPLDWITERSHGDDRIFECPKCGVVWIKEGEEWKEGNLQLIETELNKDG